MTPLELLTIDIPDFWRRVHGDFLRSTVASFESWDLGSNRPDGFDPERWQLQQLCRFVTHQVAQSHAQVMDLHGRYGQFASHVQRAATEDEQWQHQESFLRYLGYSNRDIGRDRAALKRWFGNDAIKDRYENRAAEHEHLLCFLLQRLGHLIDYHGKNYAEMETQTLLSALDLEKHITPLFRYEGDDRVPFGAMSCLHVALDHLPGEMMNEIDPSLAQIAYRIAADPYLSVWMQSEAVALLFSLDPASVPALLLHRFRKPPPLQDDFFFRGRAIRILFQMRGRQDLSEFAPLITLVYRDSSPFVRQQMAQYLEILQEPRRLSVFRMLAIDDESPQVRGSAWLGLPRLVRDQRVREHYLEHYLEHLQRDEDPQLTRLMMELAPDIMRALVDAGDEFYQRCFELLTAIHTAHEQTRVRRWAAQARERLWHTRQHQLDEQSRQTLAELRLNERRRLPRNGLTDEQLGRELAAMSDRGFGFDVETGARGTRVRGGYRSGFRLWRLLYEWRTPATDKRQNHNHTVGRIYYGHLQAPPQLMSESSETKVPGEPLLMEDEQGWRPYLPLVDQVLSSLDQGWPTRPVKLYTSEGVTQIMPPRALWSRLRARFHIMRDFKRLARLRNWQEDGDVAPAAYLASLEKYGFSFAISGYDADGETTLPVDERVARFFPAIVPFYSLGDLWREMETYFYSVYQNSVQQLTLFLLGIGGLFFGQHFWLNARF
ncbi:MAG: HEAT repeat domain-containing protein, partial [Halioglobus sp.]|nr:HEAT repeat domain-containing protein [Halioglobus sp.]